MPKRVRTPIPEPQAIRNAGGILKLAEAVALIADRLPDKAKIPERSRRDKVRKLLGRRVKDGSLPLGRGKTVPLVAVVAIARERWPKGSYAKLPTQYVPRGEPAKLRLGGAAATVFVSQPPQSLDECRRLIAKQEDELRHLRALVRERDARIAALSPKAERWDDICASNRKSAKRPRRI